MSGAYASDAAECALMSRSRLLSLLSEACELEHGLLCSYLYAAFSLKQELVEGGLTWQQQQKTRFWAAQIYAVAAEEMLHLAQVWNLLAAIGGTPYYYRPAFPVPAKYYALNIPLALTPFDAHTLKRFIMYELPSHIAPEQMALQLGLDPASSPTSDSLGVGELYALIRSGLETIPQSELIVGQPARQVGESLVDFPDIIKVADRASAVAAVDMIVGQGEGTASDTDNCHFGMFMRVLRDYEEMQRTAGPAFQPVRTVASNPSTRPNQVRSCGEVTQILEPYTRAAADLFNDVYGLMMRMLQFAFSNNTDNSGVAARFSRIAIVAMATVLKPMGEALMQLRVAADDPACAGPTFEFTRHMPLPTEPSLAAMLVEERLDELARHGKQLAGDARAPAALKHAVRNLIEYCSSDEGRAPRR